MSQRERRYHPLLDPSVDPRADRFTTTDWFLKLKETEKFLDKTTSQYLGAQRQIHEMNEVMGWLLKVCEMVFRKKNRAAREWLQEAVKRFPWLVLYFSEKRIATDQLISDDETHPAR